MNLWVLIMPLGGLFGIWKWYGGDHSESPNAGSSPWNDPREHRAWWQVGSPHCPRQSRLCTALTALDTKVPAWKRRELEAVSPLITAPIWGPKWPLYWGALYYMPSEVGCKDSPAASMCPAAGVWVSCHARPWSVHLLDAEKLFPNPCLYGPGLKSLPRVWGLT